MRISLGVDIGGTKILFAVVDEDGTIVESNVIQTPAFGTRDEIIWALEKCISFYTNKYQLKGIGMGVPGLLNVEKGIALYAANVPSLKNTPLVEYFARKFNLLVKIDNDVRVATIGEKWFGAGIDCDTLICITLGTGIGSGIILKGKLWRGVNDCAGEIGALKLREDGLISNWYIQGSLESIASGPAIATAYEKIKKGQSINGKVNTGIPAYNVVEDAKKGDPQALRIIKQAGIYLGIAIAGYVNIINPEKVIIGGGLSDVGDIIFDSLMESYNKYALTESKKACQIVKAKLGNKAGAIGAASMIFHYLDNDRFWI